MRVYLAPKCVLTLCAVNIVCTLKIVRKRDLLIILSHKILFCIILFEHPPSIHPVSIQIVIRYI